LYTWIQTGYNNVLLRKKMIDLQVIAIWLMTVLCTILGTWLVSDNYLETYYREKYNPKKGFLILYNLINKSMRFLSFLMIFLVI